MSHNTENDALSYRFQEACMEGDLRRVQRALTSGRLSAKDLDTGLRIATKGAYPDIVAALFKAGVPMSPNAIGCLCGNDTKQDPRVIRLYFDRGLKPSDCITTNGEPLLRFYSVNCARELLERGVDPNRCGPRKISPLSSSLDLVGEDNGATFDLLVQYGAKLEPSLLFDALVWRCDAAIKFRFLLSRGLDPTTTISAKWGTPLHVASISANKEVIKILLNLGADPNFRSYCTKFKNNSPVEVAQWKMRASHEGSSMKGTYQSVIELLESAQTGVSRPTIAASERSNTESVTKAPAARRTEINQGLNVVDATLSGSSTDNSNSTAEGFEKTQETRKMEIRGEGSVSSRTRSRTKTVY
ncbi:hypothetical protein BO79DRAFT_252954 [Aspergillus costaricaensis CBS 115574]|uniref:Uncharacterized protein n=1 Tax=Aspergillus costaricaensis CBS 115574 TaxID=1448317 RepID=A0ACD1IK84_9EURO|nr:hypothetical protein BO79DRAFT_252954 [Aspergillus costaricaensis CBS 115574]RAK90769.1 hypothetical protein BO79DRAFT_252954 [Aspergillus costaricaensis CBS 115574]